MAAERSPQAQEPEQRITPGDTAPQCELFGCQNVPTLGAGCRIRELEAELAALRSDLARLQQEKEQLRARAIIAEQHKVLDCLGKSSYQEVVEEKLRIELAETQVKLEQAEALVVRLQQQIRGIVSQMRNEKPRYKSHDLGDIDSVSANNVDEWADELEAAIQASGEAERQGR